MSFDYDYVIVGSGFGGSVAALRLTQKGYKVAVLELGKRFEDADFAKSNWDLKRFLWLPQVFCYGIQRLTLLKDVLILSGAGMGGGSLVYANTLYVPPSRFFEHTTLQAMGGESALKPYYALAQKMLGVIENPYLGPADAHFRQAAEAFGAAESFRPAPVGVYCGDPGQSVADPFFEGEGPSRTGCTQCGACMVGCRVGAKNTLLKNYLYLAEKLGATLISETEVLDIIPLSEDGKAGYTIVTRSSTKRGRSQRLQTQALVLSAGVLGSLELLLKARDKGRLPRLSQQLGCRVRTNSEAILGVTARSNHVDYSQGLAITSSVYPDADSHIEPVRYPAGSDAMGLLATLLTDGGKPWPRQLRFLANIVRHPRDFLKVLSPRGFAQKSMIVLFMQTLDNSLQIKRRRMWWGKKALTTRAEQGRKSPSYIPLANAFTRELAKQMDAIPGSALNEVLLDVPTTAHILGGCRIGESAEHGVIDLQQRVFGYSNFWVCDGSVMPANLGVNPSLSITAFTERAMSFIPLKSGAQMRWLKVDHSWKTESHLLREPFNSAEELC